MISRIIFVVLFTFLIVGISVFSAKIFSAGLKLPSGSRRSLTVPAIFLPLVYILSLIAIRSASFGINTGLYYVINILGGIVFYLFIGGVVLGIALFVTLFLPTTLPVPVAITILFISLALGAIGLMQATMIRTVSYTIELPNLPDAWQEKKAILVSDTHFGVINHTKFSNKVVDRILTLQPDFVFHAGDFYDGPKVETKPITASWKRLTEKVPVLYAPGNHELYGNYDEFIQSIKDAGVIVLEDSKTEVDGVQIAGLHYRERGETTTRDVLQRLMIDTTKPTILINHPPTFLKEVSNSGINLMVSGHTHRGQFWPINYLVKMIYGKYTYGHQTYETMQTITTSGVGTFGPPFRLFNPPELVILTFKRK